MTTTRYLESQVMTASPQRLVVLLYDGAIRFARRAEEMLAAGRAEEAAEPLLRAQRIVLELLSALRPEADPALVGRLSPLYLFIYEELVWANVERDRNRLAGAIRLLETLQEGWAEAADRLQKGRES